MRALALILGVLIACDAGEKPAPPAVVTPPTGPKAMVTATDDLMYLAADTDLVFAINFKTLAQSPLWPTYAPKIKAGLLPRCDYDPMPTLKSLTIGLVMESDLSVFVFRGIDRDKATKCLGTPEAGVITISKASGKTYMVAFPDATTMIVHGPKATADTMKQTLQRGAPLRDNAAFVAALNKLPSGAGIRMLARPDSAALKKQLGTMGMQPRAMWGTLRLTDRLDIEYASAFATAKQADDMVKLMKPQIDNGQIKTIFDRFDVRAQGDTVTVTMGMTGKQLESMVGLLQGMLGGLSLPD
jgi:hypothetical protein